MKTYSIFKSKCSDSERMSDTNFRFMVILFNVFDFLFPMIDWRVKKFGIEKGKTIVDYGCGPERYTARFAKLVGEKSKVYAVDIHELAIETVKTMSARQGLKNVVPVLAKGYHADIPDHIADMICAIDMFFIIKDPTSFLCELKRLAKPDGILIIDDCHQRRSTTRKKIEESGCWEILEATRDHLKCKPKT